MTPNVGRLGTGECLYEVHFEAFAGRRSVRGWLIGHGLHPIEFDKLLLSGWGTVHGGLHVLPQAQAFGMASTRTAIL